MCKLCLSIQLNDLYHLRSKPWGGCGDQHVHYSWGHLTLILSQEATSEKKKKKTWLQLTSLRARVNMYMYRTFHAHSDVWWQTHEIM